MSELSIQLKDHKKTSNDSKLILSIDYDSSGAYRCFARKRIKLNDLTKTNSNTYDYFFESIYIS